MPPPRGQRSYIRSIHGKQRDVQQKSMPFAESARGCGGQGVRLQHMGPAHQGSGLGWSDCPHPPAQFDGACPPHPDNTGWAPKAPDVSARRVHETSSVPAPGRIHRVRRDQKARLATRVRQVSGTGKGWVLLGRTRARLVPAEPRWRPLRLLLSSRRLGASTTRDSVPLPNTAGVSGSTFTNSLPCTSGGLSQTLAASAPHHNLTHTVCQRPPLVHVGIPALELTRRRE